MAGCEHRNKMGFPPAPIEIYKRGRAGIPIEPFRIGLTYNKEVTCPVGRNDRIGAADELNL